MAKLTELTLGQLALDTEVDQMAIWLNELGFSKLADETTGFRDKLYSFYLASATFERMIAVAWFAVYNYREEKLSKEQCVEILLGVQREIGLIVDD